jgi:hypothetical protein
LFDAIKGTEQLKSAGSWYSMDMGDGKEAKKFQPSKWQEMMRDDVFRQRVYDIVDEEIVQKFDRREGSAEKFYEETG